MANAEAKPLRILSLDGGGMKGYTTLLILQRIFRTLGEELERDEPPKPCEVFDLIVGTSTGGLIAIMLGRMGMTIEEAIRQYEVVGIKVFSRRPRLGLVGKSFNAMLNLPLYDIRILQNCVKDALHKRGIDVNEEFIEDENSPSCKVMVCVTCKVTTGVDALRSYKSHQTTVHDYDCKIWEAASATAAAPVFFEKVKFGSTGDAFVDGGLRRNNPIGEAMREARGERTLKHRPLGCVISIGTGFVGLEQVPSHVTGILKRALEMMTDAEQIATDFRQSKEGQELANSGLYFRFNVLHGMEGMKIDEFKKTNAMRAVTRYYLGRDDIGQAIDQCAKLLAKPFTMCFGTEDHPTPQKVSASCRVQQHILAITPCLSPYYTDAESVRREIECLDSLAFPSMHQRRHCIRPAARKTCEWLFDHSMFKQWASRENAEITMGRIQLRGNPGSGKSTLMRETYSQLCRVQDQTKHQTVAFFFDSKGEMLLHSPKGLYRSLLHQLLTKRSDDLRRVCNDYRDYSEPWFEFELQTQLLSLFDRPSQLCTTMFIDALDECDAESLIEVATFFRDLTEVAHSSGVRLNVCISSRHLEAMSLFKCPVIVAERNNKVDIIRYLEQRLISDDVQLSEGLYRLRVRVAEISSGIFLWVVLITEILMKDLHQGGKSLKDLEDRISTTPSALQGLFRDMLSRIAEEERELSLHFFQWAILGGKFRLHQWRSILLFLEQRRSMSVNECLARPSPNWTDNQVERRIRHISMGLVEIVEDPSFSISEAHGSDHQSIDGRAGSLDFEAGDTRMVNVIHQSVRDFFLHHQGFLTLDKGLDKGFGFGAVGQGYVAIMDDCLDYVELSDWDELVIARQKAQCLEPTRRSAVTSFSSASSLTSRRARSHPASLDGSTSTSSRAEDFSSQPDRFGDLIDQTSGPESRQLEHSHLLNLHISQLESPAEMEQYRLSLLGQGAALEMPNRSPLITASKISSDRASTVMLSTDPTLLSYILVNFHVFAQLAEENRGSCFRIVDRLIMRNMELWERWIHLSEDIPSGTKLLHWAEIHNLTSWVEDMLQE